MSEIASVFAACRAERRAALIPYLTAGDPDAATSERLLEALVAGGADIVELGVPFSDPIADGPTNQRAATRSLAAGTTLSWVLDLVARQRERLGVPIVLFTYFNPIQARGVEEFAEQAASSGVDGVLCVDVPPEEAAAELGPALSARGIDSIYLLAPTSDRKRVKLVGEASRGFVYYVARTGVTGARSELPPLLLRDVKKLRRKLDLPLAVGFGISTPQQVRDLGRVADGVVVGSALVRRVEEASDPATLPAILEGDVRALREALD